VDYAQGRALAAGRDPATRPVFLRLHGVAHGTLVIEPDLPADLRVGVFAQKSSYPAWVRFSSDVQPGAPDLKGTVGVAIKLFGVEGPKVLPSDANASTHDFIFQNHDVFFVDTAKDMCEFTCQSLNGNFAGYVKDHKETGRILNDMEKVVDSVLATPYWSVLPYSFGAGRYVKYKLEPVEPPECLEAPNYADPFYLRAELNGRLKRGEARFRFLIQRQRDSASMPIDRATQRWSEVESRPVAVATLVLPAQDTAGRGQSNYGEELAFNPWHALAEHAPAGSIAEARKVVYAASAESRRNVNGQPLGEPGEPRPPSWQPGTPYPPARDTRIVRASIHPAIGVARVGNSESEFFVGPQVVPTPSEKPGFYRDRTGAIKRQAAAFGIYGYNAAGEVVSELTSGNALVEWTVHVANRKAAWYQWQIALDIPEAATVAVPRRNASVTARDSLVVDGGSRTISGSNVSGKDYEFSGAFLGAPVYLGELRTDDSGRLLFFGGRGVSASPTGSPIFNDKDPNAFINADGWYDDMSDGPVTATVTIEGRTIPVEPAWVITAPPNYGPSVVGVRTLYDLLFDLFVQAGWLPAPSRVSFRRDVYPIFQRLSGLQWANHGFAAQFGPSGPNDFSNPDYIARLSRSAAAGGADLYAELRRQVFNSFRPPVPSDGNQLPWPWIYGDAMDVPAGPSPRQNATLSNTQYAALSAWAGGEFDADWNPDAKSPNSILEVPLAERPAMLDRAALEHCLADAFHPGCEVTWPIRHLTMYGKPFRIRHRPANVNEPDYGSKLTPAQALSVNGPLYAQGAGDLTRWMGLPWQADTAFCRAGYQKSYDPFQPTFWPARVPNHVLTRADYEIVIDPEQPRERRLEAFGSRISWNQPLHGSTSEQMMQMVRIFGSMGLLEVQPGVQDDPDLPVEMMVASYGPEVTPEDSGQIPEVKELPQLAAVPGVPPAAVRPRRGVAANFKTDDEAASAPLPVRLNK
jgi:hypothetical protein